MTRVTVRETTGAAPSSRSGGRVLLQVITPGDGSSGYYSPEVLEQAAKDRVFKAGTQSFLDHPSESERFDRPERSVKDLVGVLVEDARWTGSALVAEAQLFGEWAGRVADMADAIGVSIRATAESTQGTRGGRAATLITRLLEAVSVDFVTKAGRGGRVLQVLEAAGRRNTGRPVTEADVDAAAARAFGRPVREDAISSASMTAAEAADLLMSTAFGAETHRGRRVTPALRTEARTVVEALTDRELTEAVARPGRRLTTSWSTYSWMRED